MSSYGIQVDRVTNRIPHAGAGHLSDRRPTPDAVGLRVFCTADGRVVHGRITAVRNRHCHVQLEKRWNGRTKIILDWSVLRIAEDQSTPKPPQKGVNKERIDALRQSVEDRLALLPDLHLSPEETTLIAILHDQWSALLDECQSLEEQQEHIGNKIIALHASYETCILQGIAERHLPPRIDSSRKNRRKQPDQKRKLRTVREQTRQLLTALLLSAGTQGVSSDEVIAALCSTEGELPITQHRIMGMLSALSRRGEATLVGSSKWAATGTLTQ